MYLTATVSASLNNTYISLSLLAECIYKKKWVPGPAGSSKTALLNGAPTQGRVLSAEDDAKLVFGTVFSLRNLVRKLGGPEDKYVLFPRNLFTRLPPAVS